MRRASLPRLTPALMGALLPIALLAGTAAAAPPASASATAPKVKPAPRPAALAAKARRAGNWTAAIAETPGGGHRMGDPAAPLQLIEFVSYTCSHCAHFQQEAGDRLKLALVAPGKGAVEVRHVVRDPVDLIAALAADCGPAARFFGNHAAILGAQDALLGKMDLALPTQKARWSTGPWASRARAIAADMGLYPLMERQGYGRVALDQCIADEGAAKRLAERSQADAAHWGVEGTPSFALDGALLPDVHDWATLQRRLAAAGA